MAETYCGKTCSECAMKEELNCPGCKLEPGRPITGDCALARCCREKGHNTCDTCNIHGNCNTYYIRHQMPQRRQKDRKLEQERQAAIARKAPLLREPFLLPGRTESSAPTRFLSLFLSLAKHNM